MNLSFYKKGRLHYSILALLFLAMLLVLWQWVFRKALDQNYISWCLAFGSTVLILNALITAIWSGFNDDRGLISSNPLLFIASWSFVAAGISLSFYNAVRIPLTIGEDAPPKWYRMIESVLTSIVFLVVLVVLCAWLLYAVPFLYFVFLLSASPVRQSLRSKEAGPFTKYREAVLQEEGTQKREFFNFNEKPVASAFALGSLVIWAIKLVMPA